MFKWVCACAVVVFIIFVWLIWLSPAFSQSVPELVKDHDDITGHLCRQQGH